MYLYQLPQTAGVGGNPLLKTPLQNAQAQAQAQAQAIQSAQAQAQAIQAANQGLLSAHQQQGQYSALTAAAAGRAAVAGMPGLALPQG